MAESQTAAETWTLTLTYKEGEVGRDFLRYGDVQRFFKRLRSAGFQFRYIVAGELGGEKGRPHWHAIIFWQSASPERGPIIRYGANGTPMHNFSFWPHGHTVIDPSFSSRNIRYVAKYIQKAEGHAGKFVASKRPGIGQDYFDAHAKRQALARAPWAKNEFIVDDWRASMSANRWKRYKQIVVETMQANGSNAWASLPAYENTLTRSDENEMNEAAIVRSFQTHRTTCPVVVASWHKGQQFFSVHKLGKSYALAWQTKKVPSWLSGKFPSQGATSSKETASDALNNLPLRGALAICEEQAKNLQSIWNIDNGLTPNMTSHKRNPPKPYAYPQAVSQWMTDNAKALCEQLGISSRINSLPVLSAVLFSAKQRGAS